MDLYFEVVRRNTHILLQTRDSSTPKELKKVVEGILKVGLDKQTLKKRNADSSAGWSPLNDEVSLGEQGFNAKSAKAEELKPATLYLALPEDGEAVYIDPVTEPPPLPPPMMRGDEA